MTLQPHNPSPPIEPGPTRMLALLKAVAPPLIAAVLAIVTQILIRPLLGDFVSRIALDIATNIVLAVSLTMVNGFTGQFSMGHAAFMAVGGYTAAAIVYYGSFRLLGNAHMAGGLLSGMTGGRSGPWLTRADTLYIAALAAGGLVAAVCGFLVGLPSLRLRGDYLAIVTLGFGEIVRNLIQALSKPAVSVGASVTADQLGSIDAWSAIRVTDAATGLSRPLAEGDTITGEHIAAIPAYLWPKYIGANIGFEAGLPFYTSLFWTVLAAGITLIVAYRLKYSTYGRAFLSIREDEIAGEAMGVNTTRYKVWAFVISAFFAGVAGGLFAHTSGVQFKADELGFQRSFEIIIMVVLGGLGSISGAAIAAVIVTILPELLRKPDQLMWVLLPLAAVLVAVDLAGGRALSGPARRKRHISLRVGAALCLALSAVAWYCNRRGIDLSDYRMIVFAAALIILMIVRPQGLLGVRELWELRSSGRAP